MIWMISAIVVAAVLFVLLSWNLGLIRWALGGVLGIWELLRIKRRKVLI